MKRLKLFPKIFLYTMSIMLFVVVVTHGLIYLLAPQMQLALSTQDDVVVSAIILALILTLWTKTRIHEIGVFLSVGIRKSAIIGQYLIEVLLIAVLAFGLSYFTSNAIAGQIGNHLLEQSMQTGPEDDNDVVSVAASVEIGADNLVQKPLPTENGIQVSVGLDNLAQLYLIGFAIIIVAVSASSITVMRLKPREILSKMS